MEWLTCSVNNVKNPTCLPLESCQQSKEQFCKCLFEKLKTCSWKYYNKPISPSYFSICNAQFYNFFTDFGIFHKQNYDAKRSYPFVDTNGNINKKYKSIFSTQELLRSISLPCPISRLTFQYVAKAHNFEALKTFRHISLFRKSISTAWFNMFSITSIDLQKFQLLYSK
jgi:hypothetical protein